MSNSFQDFIRSHGFEPKPEIFAGKFIRFGRNNSVSAKLFDDGLAGYLHDWRTGEKYFWFANQNDSSSADYAKRRAQSKALKEAHDVKRKLAYAQASKRAEELFNKASEASASHPYLIRKQVGAYGIKAIEDSLLIPVYSVLGDIQTIQFIDAKGNKKFLKGGQMQAGCHFIGEIREGKPIYVAEGYATAASVYEDTQCLTIVAFNAGNLINVASALREQLPNAQIVIAGDADSVGKAYAEKASTAVNGSILIPDFGQNTEGYTDWNDYFSEGARA